MSRFVRQSHYRHLYGCVLLDHTLRYYLSTLTAFQAVLREFEGVVVGRLLMTVVLLHHRTPAKREDSYDNIKISGMLPFKLD